MNFFDFFCLVMDYNYFLRKSVYKTVRFDSAFAVFALQNVCLSEVLKFNEKTCNDLQVCLTASLRLNGFTDEQIGECYQSITLLQNRFLNVLLPAGKNPPDDITAYPFYLLILDLFKELDIPFNTESHMKFSSIMFEFFKKAVQMKKNGDPDKSAEACPDALDPPAAR